MEKINDCPLNEKSLKHFSMKRFCFGRFIFMILIIATISPRVSQAQIRAGSGYLKMLHGARETGIVGTLAGALDHTYSFYANPAATGFWREWQWSATYTNWISDIYQASFLCGKNIRMPWSRWTRLALGINYLGIPEFNNANTQATPVSGNNLLVTASVGQLLSFLTRHLALGANVKYFNSQLAGFEANKFIFDAGILYRTPRLTFLKPKNNVMDYLIFSAGISVTNMGSPIQFVAEETPLPQTVRAGVAINVGAHNGFQMSLGTDYRLVRDEDGYVTFGSELSWRQIIALRMGYTWEDNLLGHFTFGGGFRFDDLLIHNRLLGRNNGLRLDLATNQNNDYFAAPYHGTVTHQPLGPENFYLLRPAYNQQIESDSVWLRWEFTQDPDLFDDISYQLFVDQDSTKLAEVVEKIHRDRDSLVTVFKAADLLVNQPEEDHNNLIPELQAGDYFWTVLAYDTDYHGRFGTMARRPIAKFRVTAPDPRVIAIEFDYSPWITEDDYQGTLKVRLKNVGNRTARNFAVTIYDSLMSSIRSPEVLYQNEVPMLAPGADTTIHLEWHTAAPGLHSIYSVIKKSTSPGRVFNTFNNSFYTIPKGILAIEDTVTIQKQSHIIYDLPYVGKIFFDSSSAVVADKFIDNWLIEPPLALFAQRLQDNPTVKVTLKGTTDPNSGEAGLALANQRAQAVRDSLHSLGVDLSQMEVVSGEILSPRRLPKNAEDARWVLEERRRVDITSEKATEKTLFCPLQTTYIRRQNEPASFKARITGVVPLQSGRLDLGTNAIKDSLQMNQNLAGSNLIGAVNYPFRDQEVENWLNQNVSYQISLTDSLNRRFRNRPQTSFFRSQIVGRERRLYILARFELTEPFYEFCWIGLLDLVPFMLEDKNTRIQFVGHGCATGSEAINEHLSKRRSNDFQNKFLVDVQQLYPALFDEVKRRLDPPQGFGESVPFEIKSETGESMLIGDNKFPLGRQLNRRVMVLISSGN